MISYGNNSQDYFRNVAVFFLAKLGTYVMRVKYNHLIKNSYLNRGILIRLILSRLIQHNGISKPCYFKTSA